MTAHEYARQLYQAAKPVAPVLVPQTYEPHCLMVWREACQGVDEQAAYAFRRHGGKTGWPEGLLQDDSRELSRWFASRIDARHVLRQHLEVA